MYTMNHKHVLHIDTLTRGSCRIALGLTVYAKAEYATCELATFDSYTCTVHVNSNSISN